MAATNPFSKLISPLFKKTFTNAVNALLEDTAATVPCKLIYSSGKYESCPNCLINPVTGKSSGVYNGSGPISFSTNQCPYCLGVGKKEVKEEEEIYLMVVWDSKKWMQMASTIQNPEGFVQTFCNIDKMPKLKRAKEIYINTNIDNYIHAKYVRNGEPEPCGCCVGDEAFIVTMWKKAG